MACVRINGQLRLLALVVLATLASPMPDDPTVRVLFLTDCSPYSDWQSIAMVYSYMYSGHNGPITRVMCCSEEDRKTYSPEMLGIVETHIAASYAVNPITGDDYVAYNKPGAVIDYLEHVTPAEEWLLVLDSDMIIRTPWRVQDFNISLGWAAGSDYGYLKGVHNELADRHIPEIPRRNDTFAGPVGRRSDMVGGFFFIHRTDLKRLCKLWLKYTEDVRADPEAYHLSGDVGATKPGEKPWIAEMYGYSFGAAKANVWHHWDEISMMYPGYNPAGIPKVLHYGLDWEVEGYQYDKHWYTNFDPFKCPPWDLTPQRPQEGLFPHPPRPSNLTTKVFVERYRDLISVEGVATLNAGLCFWYRRRCPSTPQLEQECDKAEAIFFETREALRTAEAAFDCLNFQADCEAWATRGECTSKDFAAYMAVHCRPACKQCTPKMPGSEADILERLSRPKGMVMKPQPATGASAQFSVDAATPTPPATGTTTGTPEKAQATIDAAVPVTVTIGDQDAPRSVTTTEPVTTTASNAVGAKPVEAVVGQVSEGSTATDIPAARFIRTDTPTTTTTTTTTTTALRVEGADEHHEDVEAEPSPLPEEVLPDRMKLVHQLLKRCYHLSPASIDEVKECMALAKRGEKWVQKATPAKARAAGGGDGAAAKATTTDKKLVEAGTQPTVVHPATEPHALRSLPNLTNSFGYQVVVIWALLTAALYAVSSFLARRRRRIAAASNARRVPQQVAFD